MKKIIPILFMLLILPLSLEAGKGGGAKKASGSMSVQVREAIVRSSANYLASPVGTLNYGDAVNVVENQGGWCRLAAPSGWIPTSALTSHKVKTNPDQKFSGAGNRHDEVALAGKGFNPQVEAKYKESNPQLRAAYANVDKVETFGASEAELRQFKSAGKLR